jgi:hypothetical protein
VQTNPAFCCPGLITEAMAPRIEEYTGIPIVTLNYDGTNKNINSKIRPYIKFPRRKNIAIRKFDSPQVAKYSP